MAMISTTPKHIPTKTQHAKQRSSFLLRLAQQNKLRVGGVCQWLQVVLMQLESAQLRLVPTDHLHLLKKEYIFAILLSLTTHLCDYNSCALRAWALRAAREKNRMSLDQV